MNIQIAQEEERAIQLMAIINPFSDIQENTAEKVALFLKKNPNPEILFIDVDGTVFGDTLVGYIRWPETRARLIPVLQLLISHAGKRSFYYDEILARGTEVWQTGAKESYLDWFFDPSNNYYEDDQEQRHDQDTLEMDGKHGKIAKLMLEHSAFDIKTAQHLMSALLKKDQKSAYVKELWITFIQKAVTEQMLALYPDMYQLFKTDQWFLDMPEYPVIKVIGDLIANQAINTATAQAFLLADKTTSQSLEEIFLGDKKHQALLKKQGRYAERLQHIKSVDKQQLNLILSAYLFAKNNGLKKIGKFINQYMYTLVNTPQDLPEDIKQVIMSFIPSEELIQIPKPQEIRNIEQVIQPVEPKAKKKDE